MIPPPRALVLSPAASHPQDYGNRNRVWQVTSFIKSLGYAVDFILYPVEAEWNEYIPPEEKAMQAAWDSFWIIPPSPGYKFHSQALGEYHDIDEWWDEAIGNHLRWLFSRRAYDLFIVNYTFLSKAFTFAPNTTTKILETHDLFTGRKELLAKLGVEPEFFYTTEDQERIAFERADIVIAIKDSEAETIRGWTTKEVVSIPFFPTTTKEPPARSATGFDGLSVGFVGADNSINSANFQAFLRVFDPLLRIYCPPLRLLIAGNVCQRLQTDNPAISLLGRVSNLDDFYAQLDVVVAPLAQSTGIKIKVGEALAYGKAVVTTANGHDGFPVLDSMHALRSMHDVSKALIELAFDRERRERLKQRSQLAARLARRASGMGLQELAAKLRFRSPRIVVIADLPFWARGGLRAARLTQLTQLCGFLTRTINFYLALPGVTRASENFDELPDVQPINITPLESGRVDSARLAEQLDAQVRSLGITQIVLSVDQPWAEQLARELSSRGHGPILDLWCPALREAVGQARGHIWRHADFWVVDESERGLGKGELVETTALRFLPLDLESWQKSSRGEQLLLVSTAGDPFGHEAQLRMAAGEQDLPLAIVSDASVADRAEAIFALLRQATQKPTLVLAASTDTRIQHLCASVATLADASCVELGLHTFPLAVADQQGTIVLCHSCGELLAEWQRQAACGGRPCFSQHKPDTGWSRLWQVIERRLRARRVDQLGQQQATDPAAAGRPQEPGAERATSSKRATFDPVVSAKSGLMLDGALP